MSNVHSVARQSTVRLLVAGAVAGPLYVVVGTVQAMTREGFDVTRHAGSLLSNGDLAWIQIANFLVAGLLLIAGSVGLHRVLEGRDAVWAARLIGVYGLGLIAAGIFRADPALGFPPGTPNEPTPMSWHGVGHFIAGGIGFAGFIASCFVLAHWFSRHGLRSWAIWGRITGVLFFVAFAGISSGSAGPTALWFALGVLLGWIWLTAVFLRTRSEL